MTSNLPRPDAHGRVFKSLLFFGMGEHSGELANLLEARLNYGMILASGLQQPGHPDSQQAADYENFQNYVFEKDLEDVVRDIAAALLGKEIIIGEDLPYP